MVYEQFNEQQEMSYETGASCEHAFTSSSFKIHQCELASSRPKRSSQGSIHVPAYEGQPAFMCDHNDDWLSPVEVTMPLKTSEYLKAANRQASGPNRSSGNDQRPPSSAYLFQESVECRSREMSRKLVWVNLISLLINLSLAFVAFYFSFVNNSSSTSAFAADCVLDFISSGIVLWRYYGDLNSIYMHAREQIACIYLGALFEISALGIIIKASSDIASGSSPEEGAAGYDLIYLASAATLACLVLTFFKVSLYNTIRDKSILLDVINTLISTVFAMSIIMSQLLINVDASFWYMDPILSIILAIFMAGFGLKVISQNFGIFQPGGHGTSTLAPWPFKKAPQSSYTTPLTFATSDNKNYGSANWQKSDHSTIKFV